MHRIATRIALVSAVAAGGIGLVFALAGRLSFFYPLATAGAAGWAAYVIAKRTVTDRLSRMDDVLSALRSQGGRLDALGDARGDELDRLIRKADQTNHAVGKRIAELSRAENYRREYVGDVSHEIKTPIFAIQGFAETLLGGALDDPRVNRGFVEKILYNANRLTNLAKDLSEISRLEAGTLQLSRGRFHVGRVYDEVRESLELAASQKNVELRIDVEAGAELVDGDRDRIRQVVTNLVDNAIKYGEPGGWVRLGAERSDRRVRLYVQDNGIGISPDDLTRVTERFYRADKSRSRGQGGTGLGLSIVKHILAAHRTELSIESTVGEGSTFSFTLPAVQEVVSAA